MKRTNRKNALILSIAPSTRGFGFAVVEAGILVDWGVKEITGNKNARSFIKIEILMARYEPDVLVIEDYEAKGSRRSARIKSLGQKMRTLAANRKVQVASFSRQRVNKTFFPDGKGTRHMIATILAGRFSDELQSLLPPKRRFYDNEDRRMDIFNAVALAVVYRVKMEKRKSLIHEIK